MGNTRTRKSNNEVITMTHADLQALIAQEVAKALSGKQTKSAPKAKAEKLSDADMNRKDGAKGTGKNAGKVWWVSFDGTQRKWVTAESYAHIQRKRDIASGKVVVAKRSQKEKDAYKAYYESEWAKWRAEGKHTSEQNKAHSAAIKAAWKEMNDK